MNKYIVTGGLGVIGSRFVDVVIRAGHEATVIDAAEEERNLWTMKRLKVEHGDKVKFVLSRLETLDLNPLLETHTHILHAAAHTGIPHSSQNPGDDWVSNVDATRHLLESMRQSNHLPTVMLSSVKPYKIYDIPYHTDGQRTVWDNGLSDIGIDENCVLEPDEPYAASKMAQSALVMAYARTYNMPVTVLRCSNLYGDAPCHGPRHGWLTWFCISAALGWEIELQGTGFQTRDMLFSDDVASAVLLAIDNISALAGNVYNIGGGSHNQISCREAINALEQVLKKDISFHYAEGRKNEDMVFVVNHQKFSNLTGWYPTFGVMTGIDKIINFAHENATDLSHLYVKYIKLAGVL